MDGYEATKIVFSRIQNMDPENASKIMGMLLIQDHGDKEMIRLAFGSEALIQNVIFKARNELGLGLVSSNNSPPTPHVPRTKTYGEPGNYGSSNGFILPPCVTIPNSCSSPSWATMSEIQNHDDLLSPNNLVYENGVFSDPIDDFLLQDQLSFLNDDVGNSNFLHRRSCSVNDGFSEDPNFGLGWKPCLYFAKGFCKNGSSCRFLHGDDVDAPNKIEVMDQCHELLRSKSSHLMPSNSFPYSTKCINFLLQQQQNDTQRVAAVMMSEELQKFGRSRLERNDFCFNSPSGMMNPASRQIYLTFPADSTFREEDVSNYFSIYGLVQDVRIPYQQKRMFGFVTFVYSETVKLILSKGNPHFVCDARVLVKPYKEKGKIPDKKQLQQQQVDRDFSPCGTPTGLVDARDQYDLQHGGRMFYNNAQDILWRRKLQEQALELQSKRLMRLQLLDIKTQHQHALSNVGSPIPSPTQSPNKMFNQSLVFPSHRNSEESIQENGPISQQLVNGEANRIGKQTSNHDEESDLQECLEHNLPDSPFASPTKVVGDIVTPFSNNEPYETIDSNESSVDTKFGTSSKLLSASASALDMGTFKSYNCQLPRFSSSHGTIGMFAGSGGPIGI